MRRPFFVSLLALFLILSCAPYVQISIALDPTSTPMPTGTPTATPIPTQTEIPPIPYWQATNTAVFAALLRATAPSTATPIATPTPIIEFRYDEGLGADQRALIDQGIRLAQRYYGNVSRVSVYTSPTVEGLCANYKGLTLRNQCPDVEGFIAYANPSGGIFVLTSLDGWGRGSSLLRLHTIIHEYVHLVQFQLAFPSSTSFDGTLGPLWLDEGSADLLALSVLVSEHLYDYNSFSSGVLDVTRMVRAPLSQLETKAGARTAGLGSEYSLGFRAVELLEKEYGGRQAILNFFRSLNRGVSWKGAFFTAFGISIDEFYARFEEYRRANFPPLP